MLRMSNLPKPFWAEAVNTAVYVINQAPSVPLGFEIPEKMWKGNDPSYLHLRVFGCKAFMHVPKEQRLKLDSKSTSCIFVGYGDEEYSYKLFDLEKGKVVRSRDVVFYEHEMGADLLNVDKATTSDLPLATDDTSTPIPLNRPANEEVDEDVLDNVGEVHPDGDALDKQEYANDDDAPQHEEEVQEQGGNLYH